MENRRKTALMLCCTIGFLAVLGYLLQRRTVRDARQQQRSFQYITVLDRQAREADGLRLAAIVGDMKAIRRSLPTAGPGAIERAAESAATHGQIEVLKYLMEHGYDVKHASNGGTLLRRSACFGYVDVVTLLLRKQAQVSREERQEALMWAASRGHAEIVRLLAIAGADVNAPAAPAPVPEYAGLTPLMLAAGCGHADVARVLLNLHAEAQRKSNTGRTALACAQSGDLAAVKANVGIAHILPPPKRATETMRRIDAARNPATVIKLLRQAGATK